MIQAGHDVSYEFYRGERVPVAELLASMGRKLSEAETLRFLSAPLASRWRERFQPTV
ncbi:hypothetical protein D3C81_2195580 [compost metagenome]